MIAFAQRLCFWELLSSLDLFLLYIHGYLRRHWRRWLDRNLVPTLTNLWNLTSFKFISLNFTSSFNTHFSPFLILLHSNFASVLLWSNKEKSVHNCIYCYTFNVFIVHAYITTQWPFSFCSLFSPLLISLYKPSIFLLSYSLSSVLIRRRH